MQPHPLLYEASARLLLNRLSAEVGRPLSLAAVPGEIWRRLAAQGFDLLWLMGVWRRSAEARGRALAHAGLREAYGRALPDWKEEDVGGSPYAVADYTLDPALGAEGDLSLLRDNLHHAGLGLILDFVPNHLARDHAWTRDHPDRFVRAKNEEVLHGHPGWFFEAAGGVCLAHGRDPNFPSWDDTAQVNFFSPEAREALVGDLLRIAGTADGVRCDMAMLALTDIFEHVWGRFLPGANRPLSEFWSEAIGRVRARHPGFLFIAEAYWGSEPRLLELGFDYAYDKTLYDRLLHGGAVATRHHLEAQAGGAARWVRFIENHDEARAATAFGHERSLAAATAALTLPGLRLVHDGQMEGRRARLPVQLLREPEEAPDAEIAAFYARLCAQAGDPLLREGAWSLLDVQPAGHDPGGAENLLASAWLRGQEAAIVVTNLGVAPAVGRLVLPPAIANSGSRGFRPVLTAPPGTSPLEAGEDGTLTVSLGPWGAEIYRTS